jgi:hypothetical protein
MFSNAAETSDPCFSHQLPDESHACPEPAAEQFIPDTVKLIPFAALGLYGATLAGPYFDSKDTSGTLRPRPRKISASS